MRFMLSCAIFLGLLVPSEQYECDNCTSLDYMPYDGWYNNLDHPSWGARGSTLVRKAPAQYEDGTYSPAGARRPSPLDVSSAVFTSGTGLPSYINRSVLLVFYGQMVVEEIVDTQHSGCPREYFNIPIPPGHPIYDPHGHGGGEMPFLRTQYDQHTGNSPHVPRQQISHVSAFLDGSVIYGPNKMWCDALRSFKDGLMLAMNDTDPDQPYLPAINTQRLPFVNPPPPSEQRLKPVGRFMKLGNLQGNENPFVLAIIIVWWRYHNLRARQYKVVHPDWSDEQLFNEARRWTVAVFQHVTLTQWLDAWLATPGALKKFTGGNYKNYDPTINPGIEQIFQSAAMRFGHTLVPPAVYRRNASSCQFDAIKNMTGYDGHNVLRVCNNFWETDQVFKAYSVDELITGMMSQVSEREDMSITPDLMGELTGPLEFLRRDLMAINIQRGRDHGIPDYNTARAHYGLPRINDWSQINPQLYASNPEIIERLALVYNRSIDDVDVWPAGLLESMNNKTQPGELFQAVTLDQFRRIRDGDRYYFENRLNGLFTEREINQINNIDFQKVLLQVTNIPMSTLPPDAFIVSPGSVCSQPEQLNDTHLEPCVPGAPPGERFDYFDLTSKVGFGVSFALLGLAYFVVLGVMRYVTSRSLHQCRRASQGSDEIYEWVGVKEGKRLIHYELDNEKRRICIKSPYVYSELRIIDLSHVTNEGELQLDMYLSADNGTVLMLRPPHEYDLVLMFSAHDERENFIKELTAFLQSLQLKHMSPVIQSDKFIFKQARTKAHRMKLIEKFMRVLSAGAFRNGATSDATMSPDDLKLTFSMQLTKTEFADLFGLKHDSFFLDKLFSMADKSGDNLVNMRECLDFFVIFTEGSRDDKIRLLFDMYDVEHKGEVDCDNIKHMLKSLMEIGNGEVTDEDIDHTVSTLMGSASLRGHKSVTFDEFKVLLQGHESQLYTSRLAIDSDYAQDGGLVRRKTKASIASSAIARDEQMYASRCSAAEPVTGVTGDRGRDTSAPKPSDKSTAVTLLKHIFQTYHLHIFWLTLYTLVVAGIFVERAYYYSVENEHKGIRTITGYGVSVTRGAASVILFTTGSLLVTMCRNIITFLRDTFLHVYIPFDAVVEFHKYIAIILLLFIGVHVIGHGCNFYMISTQPAEDLSCYFPEYPCNLVFGDYCRTDVLPKFDYWLWRTVTGVTGVALVLVVYIIYTFSLPYVRRKSFRAFFLCHQLYVVFVALMVLHGLGRLVQEPFFHYYCLGPILLYTLDKLVSVTRRTSKITVESVELLPSDVVHLEIKRPLNFNYRSGQYVKLACEELSAAEFHPFTLTTAPHEPNIAMHIRAVGPWTHALRQLVETRQQRNMELPRVHLDGPFGAGYQNWHQFEVSVFVAGGIGVTPCASILKDFMFRRRGNDTALRCRKVYFLWVCRSQKQFEWMTDILRELESQDTDNCLTVHVYVTQFASKFDIRTTLLYICERHFYKISQHSMLTGLKAVTHFSRPNFEQFLKTVNKDYPQVKVFGVFTCGPRPLLKAVEKACYTMNAKHKGTTANLNCCLFVHHAENF